MTFQDQEISRESGSPIGFFLFEYGPFADNFFAYTTTMKWFSMTGKTMIP